MALDPEHLSVPPGWNINGIFDDSLSDPLNFGLEENAVDVLSALLTGLTILLVTDLCFRLVVRSRPTHASSRAVYRRALFQHFANPLDGLCTLFARTRRTKHAEHTSSVQEEDAAPTQKVPFSQQGVISFAGVLLSAAQVLLIFLATNRNSAVDVDKARIPAFDFTDRVQPPVYHPLVRICSVAPLTSKPGFVSRGSAFQCGKVKEKIVPVGIPAEFAAVAFLMAFDKLFIRVTTGRLDYIYSQKFSVSVHNGTQYMSRSPALRARALEVGARLFARHNLSVVRTYGAEDVLNVSTASWDAGFLLNISGTQVPGTVLRAVQKLESMGSLLRAVNISLETYAWNTYLSGVGRSALALEARTRAHHLNPTVGPFLDQSDGPLVERRRPWLSVGECLILCAAAFVLWAVVAFCVGWGPGSDERIAWVRVFQTISHVGQFPFRPDEIACVEHS